MQKSKLIELYVGAFVLLGLFALGFLAFKVSNLSHSVDDSSYQVTASFSNIGGLKKRSPVNISGVKIGEVDSIVYDPHKQKADVKLRISQKFGSIPNDSEAKILTSGLLGEQYIGIDPGKSKAYLKNKDVIEKTKSVVIIEEALSNFLNSNNAEIRGFYIVKAKFAHVTGLNSKATVAAAGVKIGEVSSIQYDPKENKAIVSLKISDKYKNIPDDTTALIKSSSLLGGQFISFDMGRSDKYLTNNSTMKNTRSAVMLGDAVGDFFGADQVEIGATYSVKARFINIGGLKKNAAVKMGGVKIGEVLDIYYDKKQFEAVVILGIREDFKEIPEDTSASIFTAGLLGSQYIALEPGGAEFFLEDGDELDITQSAIILEKVIGEFLFSQAAKEKQE